MSSSIPNGFLRVSSHILILNEPSSHPYVIKYRYSKDGKVEYINEADKYMSLEELETMGKEILEFATRERLKIKEGKPK